MMMGQKLSQVERPQLGNDTPTPSLFLLLAHQGMRPMPRPGSIRLPDSILRAVALSPYGQGCRVRQTVSLSSLPALLRMSLIPPLLRGGHLVRVGLAPLPSQLVAAGRAVGLPAHMVVGDVANQKLPLGTVQVTAWTVHWFILSLFTTLSTDVLGQVFLDAIGDLAQHTRNLHLNHGVA